MPVASVGTIIAVVVGATAGGSAPRPHWGAPAVPSHVQSAVGYGNGNAVRLTLPRPARAHDLLVAYAVWSGGGTVSVSDNRGDGYTPVATPTTWGRHHAYSASVLYAKNIVGGPTSVKVTFSKSVRSATVYTHEYSGVDAIDPIDGTSSGTGAWGSLSSGRVTTTSSGDLLFAAASSTGDLNGGAPGFTVRSAASNGVVLDKTTGAAGTYDVTVRHSTGSWVMHAVAFKPSRRPAPPPTSVAPSTPSPTPTTTKPSSTTPRPSPTPTTSSKPPSSTPTTPRPSSSSASPPVSHSGACALPNFPDASCTGVPSGTSLTARSGSMTVTKPGTVLSGLNLKGCITVETTNVVIRNSKISCTGYYAIYSHTGASVTVEDSEVDCGNTNGTGIGDTNITALRLNIHGCENGFDVDSNADIEDSYIHDLFESAEAHTDGIQTASAQNITVRHNRIYANNGTSAIITAKSATSPRNVLYESNLLAGGAYSLYCDQNGAGTNFRVVNNHFSTIFYPKVGAFGPWTACGDESLSGNVYQETNKAVTGGG